ncbi:MAG: prepilin-type N-terminal cleavage/methylation domain-containing protein [Candidatus Omnitrophica bacterium]|nr:prepilin-type N-terminal cleavage/methylation domain-containing protein [Candidatus Omnitrophota bacterium]
MIGIRNAADRGPQTQNRGFTPLEKATDEAGGGIPYKANNGLKPTSAYAARPVRKLFSNRVKEFCSLTGFTLIELLCVIVIICVFFSISIPMLSKTAGNFYLRNKAAQIKAMCELLKRASISEQKIHKLVIDFSQNSYSVLKNSHETPDQFSMVKDSLLGARTLPMSMSFFSPSNTFDKQEIIFQQTGAISSAEFFITDKKDNTAKITTTLSGEILLEYI